MTMAGGRAADFGQPNSGFPLASALPPQREESMSESNFADALNGQVAIEFAAHQQYVAISVH